MAIAAKPEPHRAAAPTHAAIAPSSGAASLIAAYQAELAAKQKAEQERLERLVSATPVAASATRMPLKHAPSVPKITSLSVSSGQPNDYLLIHGIDLGRDGEVHFVVAPGMDLKTMADAFGDTLIMVHVPTVTGIGPYSGQIYVKLTGQHPAQTNALPFAFVPTMDFVDLRPNVNDPDARIDRTALASVCPADGGVCRDGSGDFLGHKGDDILYATKMLKNGWVVQDANANGPWQVEGFGSAGNYLVDSRPGTAYPYAKVHWWMDALTSVNYAIVVVIKRAERTSVSVILPQGGLMNRAQLLTRILFAGVAAIALAMPRSAQAQAGGEPTWPQKFEIRQGENRGFAFVVTQPGPVSVNITSQGSPITVTLSGPTAEPFTQTGSGTINILAFRDRGRSAAERDLVGDHLEWERRAFEGEGAAGRGFGHDHGDASAR